MFASEDNENDCLTVSILQSDIVVDHLPRTESIQYKLCIVKKAVQDSGFNNLCHEKLCQFL